MPDETIYTKDGADAAVAAAIAAKVVVVPVGTTGYASKPDGTLWIEYTP